VLIVRLTPQVLSTGAGTTDSGREWAFYIQKGIVYQGRFVCSTEVEP
jgi:hypothetical protein